MIALPDDLQRVIDEIDAADRAADALAGRLGDEQFHWQPDGGRSWSVAQCLDHLASSNLVYAEALRSGIDAARAQGWTRRGPLALGVFGRYFVSSLEPPVKLRSRAPATTRPAARASKDEVLRRYHQAHERVRDLVRSAAAIDANRASFRNPFFRWVRVKVATGLHVIPAHDRRHIWQAEQVTRRTDFPGRASAAAENAIIQ